MIFPPQPPVRHAALAALLTLLPAALHAQQPDTLDPVLPGVRPPARVRLTLKDSTALLGRAPSARWVRRIDGTLVGLDTAFAVVRLGRGYTYTIPVTGVRLAEQSTGRGMCRGSRAAHVLCNAGGVAVGATLGYFAGRKVGHAVNDPDPFTGAEVGVGPWPTRGTVLLGVVGLFTANALGRDRWQPVVLQPAPASR